MIVFTLLLAIVGCELGPSTNILSTTQFYFIPDASYFQFRVAEAELGNFLADTTISRSTLLVMQSWAPSSSASLTVTLRAWCST